MAGGRVISAVLTLRDRDFSSNARRAGNGITDLDRRLRRAGNQVSRFRNTASSGFSSVAKSVAGLAAAYIGLDAAKRVVTSAIDSASSLEGYRNTLNVVMKDQKKAAQMMKWSVDFANKTPFETDSVVDATVKLQSYGLQAKKILPSIGNMAGVMNKDLDQAVEAVADAQTGELERMKEFGITKAMIAKKAGAMYKNQEIINHKGQIVDQKKFNNALFALMDVRFKGGMAIQSNTFKGVMSTITGVWKTGLASMAGISASGEIIKGSLFDVVKNKAKAFGDYITKLANNGTFETIGTKIGSGLKVAGFWLGVVENNLLDVYDEAKPAIGWIANTGLPAFGQGILFVSDASRGLYHIIKDNWSGIGPIIYGVTAAIAAYKIGVFAITAATNIWKGATFALDVAQGLLNGTLALTPLGWIVIGIGAVVTAGVFLYKNWDTIREKTGQLWNKLGAFKGVATIVLGPLGQIVRTAVTMAENWDSTKSVWENVWNGIKLAASNGVNDVIGSLNSLIKMIRKIPGVNIPLIPKVDWGKAKIPKSAGGVDGSGAVSGAYLATHKPTPKFASGTSYFTGGPARINERGGEIVDLPNGSRVYPHDKSVQMAKSETKSPVNIYISGINKTTQEILNELIPPLKLAISNM